MSSAVNELITGTGVVVAVPTMVRLSMVWARARLLFRFSVDEKVSVKVTVVLVNPVSPFNVTVSCCEVKPVLVTVANAFVAGVPDPVETESVQAGVRLLLWLVSLNP